MNLRAKEVLSVGGFGALGIAAGLCLLSVASVALAEWQKPEDSAGSELPDPLAAGWQGEPVCEKLHEDASVRLLRCSFPPGVGHERHFHPPHVGYVLSGGLMRVTSEAGTREIDVPSGSTFANPAGIEWHEALNVGDTTATYLMIEPRGMAPD